MDLLFSQIQRFQVYSYLQSARTFYFLRFKGLKFTYVHTSMLFSQIQKGFKFIRMSFPHIPALSHILQRLQGCFYVCFERIFYWRMG